MNILRWLLCHLLLIIVLVSLSLGFVFRDSLKEDFNQLTGKPEQPIKDETLASIKNNKKKSQVDNGASTLSMTDTAKKNPTTGIDQNKADLQQKSLYPADTGKLPANYTDRAGTNPPYQENKNAQDPWAPVVPSDSERYKPFEQAEGNASSAQGSNFPPDDYIPEENGSDSNPSASNVNSEEDALLSSSVSADDQNPALMQSRSELPAAENSSIKSSDYLAALAEVRQLYWDGKTGAAQAAYETLMFDYPAQPEAAAELGNIFIQQGNRKAASWAYQNAIPRYLNLHREQEAINLMRFISQYDPAIAESLQKKYW